MNESSIPQHIIDLFRISKQYEAGFAQPGQNAYTINRSTIDRFVQSVYPTVEDTAIDAAISNLKKAETVMEADEDWVTFNLTATAV